MMLRQPTILVVEDELLVREFLVEILSARGLDIIEAANADEALSALTEHPEIRVLFTDVTMPGRLNGCDLAREVHARRPDVGLVVTSGKRLPYDCDIPDGGVFIQKPYTSRAVAGVISRMLA